ncbi:coadhesin-like [Branchiostoma floridae x Branchiostoma belcheri]
MSLRLAKYVVVIAVLLILLTDESNAWFRRRRRRRCVVNCVWGGWSAWSACSATCGNNGTQTRARGIAVNAACGGAACTGPSRETIACNRRCCPRNCHWHDWSAWSSCTATCGSSGTRSRSRGRTPENCGGAPCSGSSSQVEACNRVCCPRNCQWGSWGSWSSCSASCGSGTQRRSRSIAVSANCGGIPCNGSTSETKSCHAGCCPRDCSWSDWSSWGNCTAPCGNTGTQTRTRTISVTPYCGGSSCTEDSSETSPCNRHCPHGTPDGPRCNCADTGYSGTCCDNPSCSSGFEFWNGACYFYSESRRTFLSAESDCDSRGATLVVVPDSATHQYLVQKANGKRNIWIGLSDRAREGTFVWSNGVSLGSFHPWRGRNNARADCVAMAKWRRTYVWKVRGCSGKLNYFCQQ